MSMSLRIRDNSPIQYNEDVECDGSSDESDSLCSKSKYEKIDKVKTSSM